MSTFSVVSGSRLSYTLKTGILKRAFNHKLIITIRKILIDFTVYIAKSIEKRGEIQRCEEAGNILNRGFVYAGEIWISMINSIHSSLIDGLYGKLFSPLYTFTRYLSCRGVRRDYVLSVLSSASQEDDLILRWKDVLRPLWRRLAYAATPPHA